MDRYIGQKAQQALEALTTDSSLEQRLKEARMHLSSVTGTHFLQSASTQVQQHLVAVSDIADNEPLPDVACKIREAIETIFEQWGREHPNEVA